MTLHYLMIRFPKTILALRDPPPGYHEDMPEQPSSEAGPGRAQRSPSASDSQEQSMHSDELRDAEREETFRLCHVPSCGHSPPPLACLLIQSRESMIYDLS